MSVLLVGNTAPCGREGPYRTLRVATIHDLAAAPVRSDRVVSF